MVAQIQEIYNQKYFEVDGRQLKFDLFRPAEAKDLPLIIFIHGGGLIAGEKSWYHDEATWLAQQGYVCACAEYRLAPQFKYPAQILDIQRFIQFAHRNYQDLKINPDKIVLFGNSAGGYLALMAGLLDELAIQQPTSSLDNFSLKVNSIISLCPVTSVDLAYEQGYLDSWGVDLNAISSVPYDGQSEYWSKFSPINRITAKAPPIFLAHGNADTLVPIDQSFEMYKALQANDIDSELHIIIGGEHSFTYEQWEQIREYYFEFLDRILV